MKENQDIRKLKEVFSRYNLDFIKDFTNIFLPAPISKQCSTFKIKTLDNFTFYVWGKNATDILNKFDRFLNLQIFM